MLKRLFCTMLTLAMVIPGGAAVSAESNDGTAKNEQAQTEEFKGFDLTFDDNAENFGFTDITVKSSVSSVQGKNGNGLSLMGVSHYLNMPGGYTDGGVYRYSFDFKKYENENLGAIVRFVGYDHGNSATGFDANKVFESIYLDTAFRYYNNLNGIKESNWRTWKMSDNIAEIKQGVWNHIDIYLDMYARYVYYYYNNEFLGKDKICPDLKQIWGVDFSVEKGRCVIDNYKLERLDFAKQKELSESGVNIPQELIAPLDVSFAETNFGYNFYGTQAELLMNLKNDSGAAGEFNMTYEVVDDKGFVIETKTEKLSFKADEKKEHKVKVNPNKYGLFTLRVKAESDKAKYSTNKKQRFALIKSPQEGLINKKMGVHTLFGNDPSHLPYQSGIMSIFEKAGFSNVRSSISRHGITNWEGWTGGKIDYGYYQPELDYKKTSKLDNMILLSGSCVGFGHMPVTDAELNDWYNFCYQVALDTKDYTSSYEIWNEPNATYFNRNATPEQYGHLVKVARDAIKKANPNAKIIGISLSGTGVGYTEAVLKTAAEYMDGVAIHPYMWMQGPEGGNMVVKAQKIREVMNKYGMQDKPLWFTEIGWYSAVGTDNQTAYTVEMFLLNEIYKMADLIHVFRYTDDDNLPREGFGLVNSLIDNDPFLARPVLAALSAYNDLMIDCEYTETIDYDESQKLYKFKLRDGRTALVMWNKDENREISLRIDAESVDVYDIYGNVSSISGIDNKYQFSCTNMPMYVVGNFDKIEKCDELFNIDKELLKIVNHDKTDIKLSNMTGKELTVKIDTTSQISAENEMKLGNEQKAVILKADDISKNRPKAAVETKTGEVHTSAIEDIYDDFGNGAEIAFYDGDNLLYKKRLEVECVDAIDVTHYSEHFAGERWQYVAEVTNNTYDTPLDGTIKINASKSFSSLIPMWRLGTIKPGETKKTTFPIPDLLDYSDLTFDAELVMSNGYSVDLSRELSFRAMPKARTAPKIDGVISDGEWNTAYVIGMNDKNGNYIPLGDENFGGNSDASAKIYMEFDDNNFYFGAEVTDDVQSDDPDRGLWAGDSFQIATALQKTTAAPYTELTIGLQNGKAEISRSSGLVAQMIAVDIPHELEIVRDESRKVTTYELSIPLTEMYPANFKIKNYPSLLLSVLLNDKDKEDYPDGGEGRDGMFEYGSGIGNSKNPAQFLDFNLVR